MGLIKTNTLNGLYPTNTRICEQGLLSAVSGVVKGKRVVMIDDSIVRDDLNVSLIC